MTDSVTLTGKSKVLQEPRDSQGEAIGPREGCETETWISKICGFACGKLQKGMLALSGIFKNGRCARFCVGP